MDTGLFNASAWEQSGVVGQLFIYVAIGLIFLSAILISFYQNTLRFRNELVLSKAEIRYCIELSLVWSVIAFTAFLSALLAVFTPDSNLPLSGFIYASLSITINLTIHLYYKYHPDLLENDD